MSIYDNLISCGVLPNRALRTFMRGEIPPCGAHWGDFFVRHDALQYRGWVLGVRTPRALLRPPIVFFQYEGEWAVPHLAPLIQTMLASRAAPRNPLILPYEGLASLHPLRLPYYLAALPVALQGRASAILTPWSDIVFAP